MMSLLLAAIAPVPPAVPADLRADLRCVAILAVHADPRLKADGAWFSAITGAAIMDATGETRESVREMLFDEVAAVRKAGRPLGAEVRRCTAAMRARVAANPR